MTEPKSAYLAIDPGDTTGWAEFDDGGEVLAYGQATESEFVAWLTKAVHSELKAVICENFVLFTHKAMSQTNRHSRKMQTSKKIGKIELTCEMAGVQLVLQPASNKVIGYKWAGLQPPSNHSISHQFDAVAHGVFYLQQKEIRKPRIREIVTGLNDQ